MKKITLTLLGLVAFTTSALAQQAVKFGPKAGVNFANISGSDSDEAKMVTSFHIGGFAEIKFNDKFAVQPEILYSGQGASYEDSGEGFSEEGKAKFSYINVPIMAKYYVIPSVAVEAGPYIGFLTKSELEYKATFEGETFEYDEDMKNGTRSVDFGLGFGASFNMDNGFFVGARYNLGLSKITKNYRGIENGVEVEYEETDVKNAVIQVSVGYKF